MEEQEQVVNTVEATATEGVTVESPATEEGVKQVASPTTESPMVPYDRFQEVIREKQELREIVKQLAARQTQGETPKQVEQDPYAGMDAEQQAFWRNADARTKRMIQEEAKKIAEPIMQQNQVLIQKVGSLIEKDFRGQHKDVIPGSIEERQIIEKINAGYSPDDAVWSVMGPKRAEAAKKSVVVKEQTKIQQKIQANSEQPLPIQLAIPTGNKLSFREQLDRAAREAGF